jgi:endoglucanase
MGIDRAGVGCYGLVATFSGNFFSGLFGVSLLDAYLWVKVPGESDGQCDAAGGVRAWDYTAYTQPGWPATGPDQQLFDPLWGLDDPAAGGWFPQQALQLAQDANP